ncbi:unnamed protein product [Phytophthora lilii]|uniref:Kinesin-like protein n=1 Tax=Phytophthora lilii TaxID=2077276 RepID=A0A9W6U3K3_9STRA|nr:unnamed protein product [Phytophthora lilii]
MKDPLAVREMIKGNGKQIYVSGLSEFRVTNLQETLQLLKTGNQNRTIRATTYNEKSSRSHALLQLSIEVESRGLESATTIIRRAKLNLVDLAGSEKWDTDVVMGSDRSKELTSINQSLSALGNVISALVNPRRTHVPYRDSKLTRLLQDSLGGNTRTVVIATVSPSISAVDETISTLQFADRAKCVTVRVKVNELVDDAILLAQAQREISRLRLLLKQSGSHQQLSALEDQVARLTKEKAALISENQKIRHTVAILRKTSSGTATTVEERSIPHSTTIAKSGDKATLAPSHPSAQSHQNNGPNVADQPLSTSSSLQLNQLRLDLKGLRAENTTKPAVFTAFIDENAENERIERATKEQELILKEIQTERRALERQLELLSAADNNQNHDVNSDKNGVCSTRAEEEPCPICGQDIDDHSDGELDHCIEMEMNMSKHPDVFAVKPQSPPDATLPVKQRPNTQTGKETSSQAGGPHAKVTPRSAASDPRFRRVSTSAHGKASPYFSNAARKPSTPPQTRISGKANSTIDREDERELKEAFSTGKSEQVGSPREDSLLSVPVANNQADSLPSSAPPQESIPILRQGHKGLKALKKFRAASPYNNALPRKEIRRISPKVKHAVSSARNTTDLQANHSTNVIVTSVRDIGLELSVYKFRYVLLQKVVAVLD